MGVLVTMMVKMYRCSMLLGEAAAASVAAA